MPDFSNGVATPGGASYMAPLLNFSSFGDWAKDFQQGQLNSQAQRANDQSYQTGTQQQQLNQQRIQQGQQQLEASRAFATGNFIDKNGLPDYGKMAQTLLKYGDVQDAVALLQQQAPPMSPMFGGAQPQGQGQGAPQPASAPARPMPAPAATSPQGDAGTGTITDLVTAKFPQQDTSTGQTIGKIATALGVDPNAQLTPGQIRRAQGLLQRYAPQGASAPNGAGSNLPPSANAVTPAPQAVPAQPQPSFNDRFAPASQPQAAPQGQAQDVPQGQPIGPQVPLPKNPQTGKPFTDPEQAIIALNNEAIRLSPYSKNPQAAAQISALNDWKARIEQSLKPMSVNSMTSLVDPRTGKTVYEGAGARAIANAGNGGESLDADAQRYRQTGTLPPNMGRGAQGAAEARAIRARAAELEVAEGGDPSKWPDRWQDYRATGVGKNAGERVKANREENLNLILKAADAAIPAALEASRALPRSDFVPLNKLIQHGEVMSSNPKLVEFGMANLQLAEHWARAMNPTGVMRESDRDKALSFLSTAFGNNTYERAVMQLQKQITRERDAVRGGGTSLPNKGGVDPGGADKDGWVAAPNGALIREKQ